MFAVRCQSASQVGRRLRGYDGWTSNVSLHGFMERMLLSRCSLQPYAYCSNSFEIGASDKKLTVFPRAPSYRRSQSVED